MNILKKISSFDFRTYPDNNLIYSRLSKWLKIKENLAYEIKQIVENEKAGFAFPSASIYHENSPS